MMVQKECFPMKLSDKLDNTSWNERKALSVPCFPAPKWLESRCYMKGPFQHELWAQTRQTKLRSQEE